MTTRFTDFAPLVLEGNTFFTTPFNSLTEHQRRIQRYKKFWDFYEGYHWHRGKETANDFTVTINYIRRIIQLKVDFLTKNGFDLTIPEDPRNGIDDTTARSEIKYVLDRQWQKNNKESWLTEYAETGAITGDVFVRVSWDSRNNFVRNDILPSHYVFPEWDLIDRTRMRVCHIIYPEIDFTEPTSRGGFRFRSSDLRKLKDRRVIWHRETWTDEKVERYKDDQLVKEEPNLFGEIPIVHVRNVPNGNSHYGISDVEDLISLQRQYNEKSTDISDIIEYHGSPLTILFGARVEDLERGPDKVWGLPEGANAKNLELTSDLKASLDFLQLLYRSMLDLAGVPEQAINPVRNVSNTPGVALHMAYLPLIDNRRKKILYYGTGLRQINRLMLKVLEIARPEQVLSELNKRGDDRYETEVSFGEALPRDESLEIDKQQSMLSMGMTTRKDELVRMGKGEKDAERIIKEADEERMKLAQIDAQAAGGSDDEIFGKRRRPDPVAQGDKVSQPRPKVQE